MRNGLSNILGSLIEKVKQINWAISDVDWYDDDDIEIWDGEDDDMLDGMDDSEYYVDEGNKEGKVLVSYNNADSMRGKYPIDKITTFSNVADGKQICEWRRSVRENLSVYFDMQINSNCAYSCSYKGPCRGTCRRCDEESRRLLRKMYPKVYFSDEIKKLSLIESCYGNIYNISRMRMGTDGKGLTTLIAFGGCNLDCKYCLNANCHKTELIHSYTTEDIEQVLENDALYFLNSGGGVVFGGGEPLLQARFIHLLCTNIKIPYAKRIETALNVPWENIEEIIDDIDTWVVDIKDINNDIYKRYAGRDNISVLENLDRLVKAVGNKKIVIKVPYIPEYNTREDMEKSARYIYSRYGIEPYYLAYRI